MSELKPCPFCGAPGSLRASSDHSTAWEGGCSNYECMAGEIVWELKKECAIAAWNRRASPTPPTTEGREGIRREALEEAAKMIEAKLNNPHGE